MKYIFSLFLFLFSNLAWAQEISGPWSGMLEVPGMKLKLVLHIQSANNQYTATLDSPSQGAKGIPVSSITFKDSVLNFAIANIGAQYEGKLTQEQFLKGTFKQAGQSFPLILKRGVEETRRPQTPVAPYPYMSEDIQFENKEAGISLAGTLTYPRGGSKVPAVILISGSGPQNRDEEIMEHKPFLVLADYLTRKGIAVLRFDDRGTGQSTGDFGKATTQDFASDVKAGLQYLKSRDMINPGKIGLIGHSEGGLVAPMIASGSKDVAFIVMLAGPGMSGAQILLEQSRIMAKASGASEDDLVKIKAIYGKAYEIAAKNTDRATCERELSEYFTASFSDASQFTSADQKTTFISQQIQQLTSPWIRYFLRYDPVPALEKTKCPVLALFGEKDVQVPAKANAAAVKAAFAASGNSNAQVMELDGLNHLFQQSTTGMPSEYAAIEQTFAPFALDIIGNWITEQTR